MRKGAITMSTGVYESILQGLNEAISTEKGHLRAKRCRMTVQPPEEFDAEEIRTIRGFCVRTTCWRKNTD